MGVWRSFAIGGNMVTWICAQISAMRGVHWSRVERVYPVERWIFCSRFLRLSVFPRCKDSRQIVMLWWEWWGRLKWRATGLDASVSFFSKLQNLNLKTGVELRTKLIECSGYAGCLLNLSTTIIVSIPPESLAITRILMLGFVEMSSIIHRLLDQVGAKKDATLKLHLFLGVILPISHSQ